MRMFAIVTAAMLVVLAIFFLVGGGPGPRDFQWQGHEWTYDGRLDGDFRYVSPAGEIIVEPLGSDAYSLHINGEEYQAVFYQRQQIDMVFPEGRYLEADHNQGEIQTPLHPEDMQYFELALAAEIATNMPVFKIVVGALVMVYGILSARFPRQSVYITMRFRAILNNHAKPTDFHIRVTRVLGGIFLVSGWVGVLMGLWYI